MPPGVRQQVCEWRPNRCGLRAYHDRIGRAFLILTLAEAIGEGIRPQRAPWIALLAIAVNE
jgi:hypothetical protein